MEKLNTVQFIQPYLVDNFGLSFFEHSLEGQALFGLLLLKQQVHFQSPIASPVVLHAFQQSLDFALLLQLLHQLLL